MPQAGEAAPAAKPLGLSITKQRDRVEVSQRENRLRRMRSGVLTAGRLLSEQSQAGGFRFKCAMLTLTYANGDDHRAGHLGEIVRTIRKYLNRRDAPMRYVWVAEVQKRGALHYHMLIWLPRGLTLPKPDKQGWWRWGSTRIEWARKAAGYLAKYVSKGEEAALPKGCRMHGSGGLADQWRQEARWWRLPTFVRDWTGGYAERVRRLSDGWWQNLETGEMCRSPWKFVGVRFGVVVLERRDCEPCAQAIG